LFGRGDLVVAGGDDENDLSLLQAADVKIAMPHAPEILRKIADFMAPPVEEQGIIHALKIVIANADSRRRE
jgi:hydroxymethylpyrimidine pyrophosphatase-like HAD family hydrolase